MPGGRPRWGTISVPRPVGEWPRALQPTGQQRWAPWKRVRGPSVQTHRIRPDLQAVLCPRGLRSPSQRRD